MSASSQAYQHPGSLDLAGTFLNFQSAIEVFEINNRDLGLRGLSLLADWKFPSSLTESYPSSLTEYLPSSLTESLLLPYARKRRFAFYFPRDRSSYESYHSQGSIVWCWYAVCWPITCVSTSRESCQLQTFIYATICRMQFARCNRI